MKTILVTGAGGYIGRHVVERLANSSKFNVIAVSRSASAVSTRGIQFLNSNIFDHIDDAYLTYGKPDILLHLAWENGFNHQAESHLENLFSHYKFVTNLAEAGTTHIAALGSMHEIGFWTGAVDENTPTNPLSLYGISKNALRQALSVFCQERKLVFQWVRGFYLYGDDEKNKSIFSKILALEANGESHFPATEGTNKYDFLSIEEFSSQIEYVISQGEINGIINCCSGKPIELKNMILKYIQENELKIKPKFGSFPSRSYDSPEIWGDTSKIQQIIGNSLK